MNKKKLRIIVDNWALQAELVKKEIKQKQGRSPGDEDEEEVEKRRKQRSYYIIFNKLDNKIYIHLYTYIHMYSCSQCNVL